MALYATLDSRSRVATVINNEGGPLPSVGTWIACPADTVSGYVYENGSFRAPNQADADADAALVAAEKQATVDRMYISGADKALATALFQVVNDVRVLKGQSTITAAQFKTYLAGLL